MYCTLHWLILDRQFGSMSEKVQDYEILLRELMDRVEDDDIELIKRALEKVCSIST